MSPFMQKLEVGAQYALFLDQNRIDKGLTLIPCHDMWVDEGEEVGLSAHLLS